MRKLLQQAQILFISDGKIPISVPHVAKVILYSLLEPNVDTFSEVILPKDIEKLI